MKGLALALLLAASPLGAQEVDTLLDEDTEKRFFLAPVVKLTDVEDEFATFVGLHLGWRIDESFIIGLGGVGLVHPEARQEMGYGGLLLEGIVSGSSVVHFSMRALIGGGATEPHDHHSFFHDRPLSRHHDRVRGFFVVEPELVVNVNFSESLRLGFGGGYRFIGGAGSRNADLSGPSGSFALTILL